MSEAELPSVSDEMAFLLKHKPPFIPPHLNSVWVGFILACMSRTDVQLAFIITNGVDWDPGDVPEDAEGWTPFYLNSREEFQTKFLSPFIKWATEKLWSGFYNSYTASTESGGIDAPENVTIH